MIACAGQPCAKSAPAARPPRGATAREMATAFELLYRQALADIPDLTIALDEAGLLTR